MSDHRRTLLPIALLLALSVLACSIGAPTVESSKPTVEILSPPSGSRVSAGEEVEVLYSATDAIAVVRVELEVEGQMVDLQTSPTSKGQPSLTGILRWTPATAGVYTVLVYAYNRDEVGSEGVGVRIMVEEGISPEATASPPSEAPTEPVAVLAYSDDFNDPDSGWAASSGEGYSYGYEAGEYYVEHIAQTDRARWVTYPDRTYSDFTAEVQVRFDTEVGGAAGGLVFRWEDNDNFYRVKIYNTGEYDVKKLSEGEWRTLVDLTESPHITSGVAVNSLKVVAVGELIQIYVNDQHLADVTDSSFSEGRVGVYASVYNESPITARISFDNLRVYVSELAGATPGPHAPPSGRIVFATDRDDPEASYEEVYVANVDGSGLTRLTDYEFDDDFPAWSPDGRQIAFVSWRDGDFEIYVMNADGSDVTRLTDSVERDLEPRWSPDGQHIVFESERDGNWEIYVMNADGSGQVNISNNGAADRVPDWSPDGQWIAFCSDRGGDQDVYLMRQDGSGVINLTQDPGRDYMPAWSPDGQRIAFESNRSDGSNIDIYVMNADGSGVARLTDYARIDSNAAWSPDGNYIVFSREEADTDFVYDLYIMLSDGSAQTSILSVPHAHDGAADWAPGP